MRKLKNNSLLEILQIHKYSY